MLNKTLNEYQEKEIQANEPEKENNKYFYSYFTNALTTLGSLRAFPDPIDIDGFKHKAFTNSKKEVTALCDITITEYTTPEQANFLKSIGKMLYLYKGSTILLLLYVLERFTENHNRTREITINFNDYFKLRGGKDRKSFKEQFDKDIALLFHAIVYFTEKNTNHEIRILDGKAHVPNTSYYSLQVAQTFIDFLTQTRKKPIMLPKNLYQLKDKNAIFLCAFLYNYAYMNHNKPGFGTFQITNLLQVCQIKPPQEFNSGTNRHIEDRIIEPLLKAFDELYKNKLHKLRYYKSDNSLCKEGEFPGFKGKDWLNAKVKIEFLDLPSEYYKRIEKRTQKNIKKTIQKKEAQGETH